MANEENPINSNKVNIWENERILREKAERLEKKDIEGSE